MVRLQDGSGTITYPDGATYEGQIAQGVRAGTGTLTMPDGLVYEGGWQNGQINGTADFEFLSAPASSTPTRSSPA